MAGGVIPAAIGIYCKHNLACVMMMHQKKKLVQNLSIGIQTRRSLADWTLDVWMFGSSIKLCITNQVKNENVIDN